MSKCFIYRNNFTVIFSFDLDPTKRETFWIVVIGLTVHWMAQISIHQSCVQKFLALPTMKNSVMYSSNKILLLFIYFINYRAVILYNFGMSVMKTASVLTAFIIYAKYSDCDPFMTKQVTRNDQLLPYYVMDVARNIPGLSGLFIAGIFSAALRYRNKF